MKMFQDVGDVCTSATTRTPDTIIFFHKDKKLAAIDSSMVPPAGGRVALKGTLWEVLEVTYKVSEAADYCKTLSMKAIIYLQPLTDKKGA